MRKLETIDVLGFIDDAYEQSLELFHAGSSCTTAISILVGYANAILDVYGPGSVESEYAQKKLEELALIL